MERNGPSGRVTSDRDKSHLKPGARHGDVGPHGDIVDELRDRLRRQVGPDRSPEIIPDEQADLVLALLAVAGVRP